MVTGPGGSRPPGPACVRRSRRSPEPAIHRRGARGLRREEAHEAPPALVHAEPVLAEELPEEEVRLHAARALRRRVAGGSTLGVVERRQRPRLGQLVFSIREAGWDRNRMGSLISEVANEGSWIVATVVWLLV